MKPRPKKTATAPLRPVQLVAPSATAATRRRILVVDDHPFMRAGLAQLIDRQPDMQVAGEAGNPAEAIRELARSKPDLVLTDAHDAGPQRARVHQGSARGGAAVGGAGHLDARRGDLRRAGAAGGCARLHHEGGGRGKSAGGDPPSSARRGLCEPANVGAASGELFRPHAARLEFADQETDRPRV